MAEQTDVISPIELETSDNTREYKQEKSLTKSSDISGIDKDKESISVNLNTIGTRQENQNIKSLTPDDFTHKTNNVEISGKNISNDTFLESLRTHKGGNEQACADYEKTKTSFLNVPLQQSFELSSETSIENEEKEKYVNNFGLVNNEQIAEQSKDKNKERPDCSDEYTSSTYSDMQFELEENNRHRHETSATIINDQVHVHSSSFLAI